LSQVAVAVEQVAVQVVVQVVFITQALQLAHQRKP
jgi:hypothetical protein